MNAYQHCPVCHGGKLEQFLNRPKVPVHQNLLMNDREAALSAACGKLELFVCGECGFVFNGAFDLAKLEYGDQYENAQYYSPCFDAYLDELVSRMVSERGVRNCHIVEVGCGQGLFLRRLVEYDGSGNTGHGFDPSYRGALSDLDGRLQFANSYYSEECADVPADVVVSRHVIEHVPNPLELLHNVRKALVNASGPRIFCETPCVEWILRNQVIWDFFYEHCSYFSASSLRTAFEIAGFQVERVEHVFGGQYLWLEATKPDRDESEVTKRPESVVSLSREFGNAQQQLTARWQTVIRDLAAREKVALWGAGAKGVSFANLIESRPGLLDCIIDLNPQKQGHYIPGSGHPIVAPQELGPRGVTTAILMNPNYREENLALLERLNLKVRLIDHL